jgi:hypothetical protein
MTPIQRGLTRFSDLVPDDRNANRGSKRGAALIKESLKDYSAGRSILLDKNNRVIAGNKTLEQASGKTGIKGVRVIETDGTELIAVRRTDLDLKLDARAKSLAIADNRAGEVSLEWDPEILRVLDAEVDLSQFWAADELEELLGQAGNQLLTDEDESARVCKLLRDFGRSRRTWLCRGESQGPVPGQGRKTDPKKKEPAG